GYYSCDSPTQRMRYAAAVVVFLLLFHTLGSRSQDFIPIFLKPQPLSCTQFTPVHSEFDFTCCILTGENTLQNGPTITLPTRTAFQGIGNSQCVWCDYNGGTARDDEDLKDYLDNDHGRRDGDSVYIDRGKNLTECPRLAVLSPAAPAAAAFPTHGIASRPNFSSYAPPAGALGDEGPSHGTPAALLQQKQQEEKQQPNLITTLDLASLSNIFTVAPKGQLALHNLHIIGALLPTSPYPLPAVSFLALSAFNISAATAAAAAVAAAATAATAVVPSSPSSTARNSRSNDSYHNNDLREQQQSQQQSSQSPLLHQPPLPPLILSDLVISTPSCEALMLHQAFACDASPSPNFTVTPTALVVHRYSTPTASITNVTLTCTREPPELFKCLAARTSTGAELLRSMAEMDKQVNAALLQFAISSASMIPTPAVYLHLERNITFTDALPATSNNATSNSNISSSSSSSSNQQQPYNHPITTVSTSRIIIFG
ncbi:hypothetical protein Vafri_14668, partial [Volvox africanus]